MILIDDLGAIDCSSVNKTITTLIFSTISDMQDITIRKGERISSIELYPMDDNVEVTLDDFTCFYRLTVLRETLREIKFKRLLNLKVKRDHYFSIGYCIKAIDCPISVHITIESYE